MEQKPFDKELRSLSVLVVDDHEINREYLRAALVGIVARLDAVDSGTAAIDACREQAYDVILMDLHMPQLDGLATANRIRDLNTRSSRARMLVLTADARAEERERLLNAGFEAYLSKPLSISDLTAALCRVVNPGATPAIQGDRYSPGNVPLLDFKHACAAANGDAAIASRLSRLLGAELKEKLPELDLMLAEGQDDAVDALLHQWAGAAGFAGALQFSRSCSMLHQRRKHPGSPGTAYADFLRIAHATSQALLAPGESPGPE